MSTSITTISPEQLTDGVRAFIRAAEEHDGVAPLSEQFLAGLGDASLGHTHRVARVGGQLAGLAAQAPDGSVELVVHPDYRRRGVAKEFIALLVDAPGNQPQFWAHGNLPAAQATAESVGLEATRELLVMSAAAGDLNLPHLSGAVPNGYEAVNYPEAVERFGRERVERDWLRVNNDAFSWHPEQGGWDMDRLHRGMAADWFDPAGVWFLYAQRPGEREPDLAGFHWTKRHPGGVGEVYVVGLASGYRGEGLGVPLMAAGLRHLVEGGSSQVILYVEADNEPAVRRYDETGFTVAESHVVYQKPAV
ncbi:mycothiol synthase [Corynebacterium bouchesdurhonense]|uniref:mycothiol synthase n=1 Tax=Corynebacterium bouchesdurhonense TaxID=1720192 RepID=UPI00082C697F|nr:mycothiol synthase [Corynebacterium bouchesdurhonense]